MSGDFDSDDEVRLQTDQVVWQKLRDEVVALSLGRSEYVSVNHSGIELWELLAHGASVQQLAARLRERWGIDAEQAQRDVRAFLSELSQAGLLA